MLEIRRTKAADDDLDDIFAYIAVDNLAAAERVIRRIEDAEARLAEYPDLGRTRDTFSRVREAGRSVTT